MKNKFLYTTLALVILLFFWNYSGKNEINSVSTAYIKPADNNLKDGAKSLKKPHQPIFANSNSSELTTSKIESKTEIANVLDKLKDIEKDEDIEALVFSWKEKLCSECLHALKQILANNKIDKNLRTYAAHILAKIGTHESVIELMQALNKKVKSESETAFLEKIATESISLIYEQEGVGTLAYILTNQQEGIIANQLSAHLINNMNNSISSFGNKDSLAFEITKQYWDTQNTDVQQAIIGLNHPQTLAKLVFQVNELGDTRLQDIAMEKLVSNPNNDSLDALMSLGQKNISRGINLSTKLDEWTQSYIQLDREGHLVDYLSNPGSTKGQREMAAELLANLNKTRNILSEQENKKIQDTLNKFVNANALISN